MLLDDLVKASVVELNKFGKVMDVGDDIAKVFLEQHELLLTRAGIAKIPLIEAVDDFMDLSFTNCDASRDLHGLYLLLGVDLLKLLLELGDKARLILLSPLIASMSIGLCRTSGLLEFGLESIVI